jgi:hypothetical protein
MLINDNVIRNTSSLSLLMCACYNAHFFSLFCTSIFLLPERARIYIHVIGNKLLTIAILTYISACWQRKKKQNMK